MTKAPPSGADGEGRRAALLLAALRLSRDPELLPRLEAALAALDDGRRPPAAARRWAENALLRRLQAGLAGTLRPADAAAWDAERRAEAEAGAAEAWAWRLGHGPAVGAAPPRATPAGRRGRTRAGAGTLHLLDGRPVRAEGAVLLGPEGGELGAGIEAWRVDAAAPPSRAGPPADGGPAPPPDRPWAEQVWARPLGGGSGAWRRGRLRPEPGRLVFVDEPAAEASAAADGREGSRDLGRDLLGSAGVRRRAAAPGGAYARLLHAALEGGRWRHADGAAWAGGPRAAAEAVARVAGGDASHPDWAWDGPAGVLDEQVLADLGALGWAREADG